MNNLIRIEPEWIPRNQNKIADYLSHLVDYDNWMLNPEISCTLNVKWGPHTINRFANSVNAQLVRYNSRYWEPGTEAVDAFTCSWADDNNWLCPPIYVFNNYFQCP